jgi:hypothetical protein
MNDFDRLIYFFENEWVNVTNGKMPEEFLILADLLEEQGNYNLSKACKHCYKNRLRPYKNIEYTWCCLFKGINDIISSDVGKEIYDKMSIMNFKTWIEALEELGKWIP